MNDSLTLLLEKAKNDKLLKERIYATRADRNPVNALCELSTAEGFPITAAELIDEGETSCAAMLRSVEWKRPTVGTTCTRCFLRRLTISERQRKNEIHRPTQRKLSFLEEKLRNRAECVRGRGFAGDDKADFP